VQEGNTGQYSMCLVMALAEGGGSLCHCEPVVVVVSNFKVLLMLMKWAVVGFGSSHTSHVE
jgi:hypothetical protein